jgi:hypothetical protein
MKALITTLFLLLSIVSRAEDGNGYIQNMIEDDGGVKIILSEDTPTPGKPVKTFYLPNTQSDFQANKKILDDSKLKKSRLSVTRGNKSLSVKAAGH